MGPCHQSGIVLTCACVCPTYIGPYNLSGSVSILTHGSLHIWDLVVSLALCSMHTRAPIGRVAASQSLYLLIQVARFQKPLL